MRSPQAHGFSSRALEAVGWSLERAEKTVMESIQSAVRRILEMSASMWGPQRMLQPRASHRSGLGDHSNNRGGRAADNSFSKIL